MILSRSMRLALVALVLALLAGSIWYIGQRRETPQVAAFPGMVRQTEIRIAPEITGRLRSIIVTPGQRVRKGEVLATLSNPELSASVAQAQAALASARAERARVYSGVRAEMVAIAAQSIDTAQANLLLAQQQVARSTKLVARNFASQQQHDENVASLGKAQADLDLRRAQYAAAKAGPTNEERQVADANVALAEASLAELEAKLAKTTLTAPVDGVVGIQVSEVGEIIPPGKPIVTIDIEGERWFSFTLREDFLKGLNVGAQTALTRDDGSKIDVRVTEVRPLGEFATWRAARAVGDHDLNSFRLRFDPVSKAEELEPGMTVWLE